MKGNTYIVIGGVKVDLLVPEKLLNMLMMATPISILVMAIIQKFKRFTFVKNENQLFILNFFFSLSMGTLFSLYFYEISFYDSLWVSFISFIGAPSIYELLKKQNIINYTPKSLSSTRNEGFITVPIENKIKRDGMK